MEKSTTSIGTTFSQEHEVIVYQAGLLRLALLGIVGLLGFGNAIVHRELPSWILVAVILIELLVTVYGLQLLRREAHVNLVWTSYIITDSLFIFGLSFLFSQFIQVFFLIVLIELAITFEDDERLLLPSLFLTLVVISSPLYLFSREIAIWPVAASFTFMLNCITFTLLLIRRQHRADLAQYEKAQEVASAELKVAWEIQSTLMAPRELSIAGWQIAGVSLPAKEVGGDFYEYIGQFDQNGGIAIGDVSGKGIPAALQMAVVRTLLRVEARRSESPSETLAHVNRSVLVEMPVGMITLLYAAVNPDSGMMRWANAGHTYPYLLNDTVHELKATGLPLGISADTAYRESEVELHPGDSVVFYTDGVVEANNRNGELFGFTRFLALLHTYRRLEPRELVQQIVKEVKSFAGKAPQFDDVTVVVLQRRVSVPHSHH